MSAQNTINIQFEISQNASQLVLDSVLIQNLTNGTDTCVYNFQSVINIDINTASFDAINECKELNIKQNYPNPCNSETIIEATIPGESVEISVYEISGKIILNKKINTGKGKKVFYFNPNSKGRFIVAFKSQNQEKAIAVTSFSNLKSQPNIRWSGNDEYFIKKIEENSFFSFENGDILKFTGYVTACQQVEYSSITDSPTESQTYVFDFTNLLNLQPESPIIENVEITENTLSWQWNYNSEAIGYKYNVENDFNTAIELSEQNNLSIANLLPGTYYNFWLWAYNDCGESFPVKLSNATQALAFSDDENALILSASSTQAMYILSICDENDTLILRAISSNVIISEENLQYLIDRMKKTVQGKGVGLAAPQVGLNRNIVWIQRYDKPGIIKPWECYINPRITEYSNEYFLRDDGCLSVETDCQNQWNIVGKSWRANWVNVEYYLPDGTFIQETITHAYTAHIFQHELDHLNGIMFFDRQTEPSTK